MIKTITVPVHDRPEYFEKMLECLNKCRILEEYILLFGCEPTNKTCIELAHNFKHPHKNVYVNTEKKGVRKNPYDLLEAAFVVHNSDVNFHVEEDVVFSPDCLEITNWFLDQDPKYGFLSFFNRNNKINESFETLTEYIIPESGQHNFTPFVWSARKNFWKHIQTAWWTNKLGWDYSIVEFLKASKHPNLIVNCTRANHIGEKGTYMTSNVFEEHYKWRSFAENVPHKLDYKIVDL